ncbi:hypothetical protein DH2020_025681 [Rehmannia glutinosa]|uniref:Reverse transcriptase domain-containing protein n=1 Tax=Rehmannia glutinosa TaxID=99300 RepID=A0ABR0W0V6_REHGL
MSNNPLSLDDLCGRMQLAEEDEGGLCIDDTVAEGQTQDLRWCLVGRFLTDRQVNFLAMKNTLASVWRPVKGVFIKELGPNLFLFQFFHELDITRVQLNGPWTFDNLLLITKRLNVGEQPSRVELFHTDLWVQVYDLPFGFMTEMIGTSIGNFIDKFCDKLFNGPTVPEDRAYGSWMPAPSHDDVAKHGNNYPGGVLHAEGITANCGEVTEGSGTKFDDKVTKSRDSNLSGPSSGKLVIYDVKNQTDVIKGDNKRKRNEEQFSVTTRKTGPLLLGPVEDTSTSVENQKNLDVIWVKLGYEGLFAVSSMGHSGGLSLFWKYNNMANLLSFSQNHIDVSIHLENTSVYRLTGYYGFPERGRRRQSWNFLRHLANQSTLPWCCIGDFNDLLSSSEKRGNIDHPSWLLTGFRSAIDDCGLVDLGMLGYQFTWERGRGSLNWVEERLDRGLATLHWFASFPNCKIWNLEASMSDHSPILLELGLRYRIKKVRKFRFENVWLREKECKSVVQEGWNKGVSDTLLGRIEMCGAELFKWGDILRNSFNTRIKEAKSKMKTFRGGRDQYSVVEFKKAQTEYNLLLAQQEDYWKQRAKLYWLKGGDSNSKYFHTVASTRHRHNSISKLKTANGIWLTWDNGLGNHLVNYFMELFSSSGSHHDTLLDCICPKITEEQNLSLLQPFTELENNPETVSDLRPIALCNVIYKVVSKLLANRLKHILPEVISEHQSAFVPQRLILDNIMIAFEINHFLKRKRQCKHGVAALKIDMSKAYDRIEWPYLKAMLLKLGFHTRWVELMMLCVTTVRYKITHGIFESDFFTPRRGLRQGDPLSPYLFILCAEGLSFLIQNFEKKGWIHGCQIARRAPSVTHLFFADNSFLFFRANREECTRVLNCLDLYSQASGQLVNYQKSSVSFSKNTESEAIRSVCSLLNVPHSNNHGAYLGLPSLVGRNKKEVFAFIREKVWHRLQGWRRKIIIKGGKGDSFENNSSSRSCISDWYLSSADGASTWSKPSSGSFKCNVDAALFHETSLLGFGSVIRDCHGSFVAAIHGSMKGPIQPEIAKAMSMREALRWLQQSWKFIEVLPQFLCN